MTQDNKQMPEPGPDGVIVMRRDKNGRFPGLVEGVDVFYPPPNVIRQWPTPTMQPPKQGCNK